MACTGVYGKDVLSASLIAVVLKGTRTVISTKVKTKDLNLEAGFLNLVGIIFETTFCHFLSWRSSDSVKKKLPQQQLLSINEQSIDF